MKLGAIGLSRVRTPDLHALLRAVHRGELPCPITQTNLGLIGLLRLGDDLGHLHGLDARAAIAVIVAVLAERGPHR
jgi:hypothetical protein